jgi:uncharacterized protein (TIGR00255 family)
MTGFGEATAEVDGVVYTVEMRTVNNRYFKSHLRLPDIMSFLEGEVEKLLRSQVHRGTINCLLYMKNVSGEGLFGVDENALQGYIKKLQDIAEANEMESRIDLAKLLTLPGIVQPICPDEAQVEVMKRVVLELIGRAIDQLKQMRLQEGAALAEDLTANCRAIREKLQLIRDRSGVVLEEYHDKLEKRVNELVAGAKLKIDGETLARETAIFAERCDIAEELTRLDSHLEQFTEHCQGNQDAGRRLDFISQEMLREANTIASKASDAQIGRWVIDIKCAIDRIKEQVQNIE